MPVLGLPAQPAEGLRHPGVPQRRLEHPLQDDQLRHQPVSASALARSGPGENFSGGFGGQATRTEEL